MQVLNLVWSLFGCRPPLSPPLHLIRKILDINCLWLDSYLIALRPLLILSYSYYTPQHILFLVRLPWYCLCESLSNSQLFNNPMYAFADSELHPENSMMLSKCDPCRFSTTLTILWSCCLSESLTNSQLHCQSSNADYCPSVGWLVAQSVIIAKKNSGNFHWSTC